MDWRHQAACRDEDPELFFPIGIGARAIAQTERAKAVCACCDVVEQCLEWALETKQEPGVWGGLSEDERRSLRRKQQRRSAVPSKTAENSTGPGTAEKQARASK